MKKYSGFYIDVDAGIVHRIGAHDVELLHQFCAELFQNKISVSPNDAELILSKYAEGVDDKIISV